MSKKRYVAISGISHIHNTVYHLPFHSSCLYLICRFALHLTQNKTMSAFIIAKLSRLCDGTQEHLLSMHLSEDTSRRSRRNRTRASNKYMEAYAHTHTGTYQPGHPLFPSPADRQMARVTLSHWHGGAYNLKPCLHLKIHQYHIDVQYTSCQRGNSRLQWALTAVPYA